MRRVPHARAAVAGFRVKSGLAVAVVLAGSRRAPEVVERGDVALCDLDDPDTRQPYHAGVGSLETDERRLAARIAAVRKAADRSVRAALDHWQGRGVDVRSAALVVGTLNDPGTIANDHIRAHALEGRLFRTVLADALAAVDVPAAAIVERDVYEAAASTSSLSVAELRSKVTELGRSIGKPWKADHKLAALAAWCRLSR